MLRQVTEVSPMADLIALARQAEEDGALSVSIFGGFPLSDTENTGLGVVAVTLKSDGSGQKICDQIVKAAMQLKEDFTMSLPSLQSSVATAKALTEYPVLLIDTADNCHSGGTQDCMGVIQEALKQGLTNILAGPIVDPVAVAEALSVSLGETITVSIGGKSSFAAVGQPNNAMTLTGKVTAEADGKFEVTGPLFTGAKVNMGRTVLFDAGNIRVVISEDRFEAMDFAMYGILGIDVMEADYVVLKSKIQYRPTFGTIAKHIVECHSVGVASLDPTVFAYQHLARPIYPLDAIE
jgi:microcystin degradation protein MlrC